MKIIKKGIATTIFLDQPNIPQASAVKLTIVGEDGVFIKNAAGDDLSGVDAVYDATSGKFKYDVTINDSQNEQFIRLYWSSTNAAILDDYYPEDAKLAASILTPQAEIVPVTYFLQYYQNVRSNIDPDYQDAMDIFMADKIGLKSTLMASQGELERDLEIYLTERTLTEKRDNYFERFNMNMWLMQATYPPINELTDVQIWYGGTQITGIDVSLFTFYREMGIIEFLPLPAGDSAGLYTLLLSRLSGIGLAILGGGILDRIPNMFHFTYKTGLWTADADPIEKEGIRAAICRRTLINLAHTDPASRKGSVSESTDGTSASNIYNPSKFFEQLDKQEKEWEKRLRQKYAKEINATVA